MVLIIFSKIWFSGVLVIITYYIAYVFPHNILFTKIEICTTIVA